MGLFEAVQPREDAGPRPLADRMRPQTLDEFVGQEELLAPGKPLRTQIERDDISSMLLWGPPGCGKTTLARIIARRTRSEFVPFSAVLSGIKEIKQVMEVAERRGNSGGGPSCSSTKSIASTRRSRMRSCPTSNPAASH